MKLDQLHKDILLILLSDFEYGTQLSKPAPKR